MSGPAFPTPADEVISIALEIFRKNRQTQIVDILEGAQPWFDAINFDNWNGGITTWALRLQVPVAIYAGAEPDLGKIETAIKSRLGYLARQYPNQPLEEVTILPIAPGAKTQDRKVSISESEVRRIWPDHRFRLFLSHVSVHKIQVAKLKDELSRRGIAAFVAHEAIEPSLEWQKEIELGLRSMHALAALLTADFHSSKWTDQEIGWALGRDLFVLPVRLQTDPYGFFGKTQAVSGSLDKPDVLAHAITVALLKNTQTHGEMRRSIVETFATSSSVVTTQALVKLMPKIDDFTDDEKKRLLEACENVPAVSTAYHVPRKIREAFGIAPTKPEETPTEDVPF